LGSAYTGGVSFLSDTGTLKLDASSSFAGTVSGLRGQDAIDLADIGFGASTKLGYSANADNSGGTLTVGDGTHAASLALLGSYMASSFAVSSDGHGGTLISEAAMASAQSQLVTQLHAGSSRNRCRDNPSQRQDAYLCEINGAFPTCQLKKRRWGRSGQAVSRCRQSGRPHSARSTDQANSSTRQVYHGAFRRSVKNFTEIRQFVT